MFITSTCTFINLGPSKGLVTSRDKRGIFGCPQPYRASSVRCPDASLLLLLTATVNGMQQTRTQNVCFASSRGL